MTRYVKTTSAIKTADLYSHNIADVLAYFLSGVGPVSTVFTIDVEGINELLIRRGGDFWTMGWQISDVQKGMDFLSLLMRTGVFQLTPMLDGSVKPYIYKTTVDADALRIDGPDIISFRKYRDTQAVKKAVIANYNYRQYLDEFQSVTITDADAEERYGAKDYLELDMAFVMGVTAQTAGEFFSEMYKQPPTKVRPQCGRYGYGPRARRSNHPE